MRATADGTEWWCGLNALRVLTQLSAAEQIVGPERRLRVLHSSLVRPSLNEFAPPGQLKRYVASLLKRRSKPARDLIETNGARLAPGNEGSLSHARRAYSVGLNEKTSSALQSGAT